MRHPEALIKGKPGGNPENKGIHGDHPKAEAKP
jgi:hypothetical protein